MLWPCSYFTQIAWVVHFYDDFSLRFVNELTFYLVPPVLGALEGDFFRINCRIMDKVQFDVISASKALTMVHGGAFMISSLSKFLRKLFRSKYVETRDRDQPRFTSKWNYTWPCAEKISRNFTYNKSKSLFKIRTHKYKFSNLFFCVESSTVEKRSRRIIIK